MHFVVFISVLVEVLDCLHPRCRQSCQITLNFVVCLFIVVYHFLILFLAIAYLNQAHVLFCCVVLSQHNQTNFPSQIVHLEKISINILCCIG